MANYPVTIDQAKEVVHTIVQTIYRGESGSGGFVPTEVIKAGSLGHGTAVPGKYDLDLVVYSRDIDGRLVVRNGYDKWLHIMESFLERKFAGRMTEKKTTVHSRQFKFDRKIDVDMLVSPFWESPRDFYEFLKTIRESDRFTFSVSASKWQVEFFSHQCNQVKEFIKRAKAWRNEVWKDGKEGKPKSFLMSVIVLRAYERAKDELGESASTQTMAERTTAWVKHIVKNHMSADIYWEEYYKKYQYPELFPSSHKPRMVDPANPSNNLHDTGICGASNKRGGDYGEGGGAWDNFVRFVSTLDLTQTVEEIQSGAARGAGYRGYY